MNLKPLALVAKYSTNHRFKSEKKKTINFDQIFEKQNEKEENLFITKVDLEILDKNPYYYLENFFLHFNKNRSRDLNSFTIFNNLTSDNFVKIKKSFNNLPNKEADVFQFTSIIYDALCEIPIFLDKYEGLVKRIIETFFLIDSHKRNLLNFTQFSNFVIDFQADNDDVKGVISDKVRLKFNDNIVDNSSHSREIEKMMAFPEFDEIAIIDQNIQNFRLYDVHTLKEKQSFSLPNCTITSATIFNFNETVYVLLCTNDQYINFLESRSKKVVSRFQAPEVQNHVFYVQEKAQICSVCTSSGTIYVWNPSKIFSQEFLDAIKNIKENYKMVLQDIMKDQQKDISCIIWISQLKIFATGASDGLIRFYENKYKISSQPRSFRGHKKGIRSLDYSVKYNQLVSCSFDFDVILWNPFSLTPIMKFQEHDVPLLSVHYFDEMQCVISCDTKGVIKLWDCFEIKPIQTAHIPDANKLKGLVVDPKKKRIFAGVKQIHVYDFDKGYQPKLTFDLKFQSAVYSEINQEFYIFSGKVLRAWTSKHGVIAREYKIQEEDTVVTCMVLDDSHSKIFIGLQTGKVLCVDIFTGNVIRQLLGHKREILHIDYAKREGLILTAGADNSVKIHMDTNDFSEREERKGVLRIFNECHEADLVAAAMSDDLMLFATASRDNEIRIWHLDNTKLEVQFTVSCSEIYIIRFIEPYPLLLLADVEGTLSIWSLEGHKLQAYHCLIKYKNLVTIKRESMILKVDFDFVKFPGSKYSESLSPYVLELILGDESGYITCLLFRSILEACGLDAVKLYDSRRLRIFDKYEDIEGSFIRTKPNFISEKLVSDINDSPTEEIIQAKSWKGHSDKVLFVKKLRSGLNPFYFSIGDDCLGKLWNSKGEHVSSLVQGHKINTTWNLPLDSVVIPMAKEIEIIFQEFRRNFSQYLQERKNNEKKKLHFVRNVDDEEEEFDVLDHGKEKNFNEFKFEDSLGNLNFNSTEIYNDLREVDKILNKKNQPTTAKFKDFKVSKKKSIL